MPTFSEFLKEQAQRERNQSASAEKKRDEWVEAVSKLVEELTAWLKSVDTEHILKLEPHQRKLREEGLGTYFAPGLIITLGARQAMVVPVARNVVGGVDTGGIHVRAEGRVDLTNVESKYILYRVNHANGKPGWMIVDPQNNTAREFDKQAFESALQNLFE